MSENNKPVLPVIRDEFDTSEIVLDSYWITDAPDEQGNYHGLLLTVGDSEPYYSVIDITCDPGKDEWEVSDVAAFYFIMNAASHFQGRIDR